MNGITHGQSSRARLRDLYDLRARVDREIRELEQGLRLDWRGDLLARVAAEFGVDTIDLLAHDRRPHLVTARRVAVVLLRARGESYPQIGRLMRRHHVTILGAARAATADDHATADRLAGALSLAGAA